MSTILSELSESLDAKLLAEAAHQGEYEVATIQRLGFLLDHLGFQNKTDELQNLLNDYWITKKIKKKYVALTPGKPVSSEVKRNKKWRLIFNDVFEVDEL